MASFKALDTSDFAEADAYISFSKQRRTMAGPKDQPTIPSVMDFLDDLDNRDIDLRVEGVDDESMDESEDIQRFNISSYGADYTVDSLVKRLKTNAFYVPPFQRAYVWSQKQASRFIESLLLGLPVPGIFLYKEPETNRHLVIDGQQRLRTLQFFVEGFFQEKKFRLTNISSQWEGKTYEELEQADQLKLDDAVVHATVFQQLEPQEGDSSIYFVFERINTGGMRLSSQEIRVCLTYGPFAALLLELSKNESWRMIYGSLSKRLKDQELILRFLAFYFGDIRYERPMSVFLNQFMALNRKLDKRPADEFTKVFSTTIAAVAQTIGPRAFRPVRSLNAAVFDSVMVALATRLAASPIKKPASLTKQYDALLSDSEYQESITRSTSNEDRVKNRMEIAKKYLSKVE